MTTLAHHLLGSSRSAVLAALLLHPETALHVRELARVTGTSPGSLHRELRALTDLGLLLREEVGRQVNYRANTESPVFDELSGLLRKSHFLGAKIRNLTAPIHAALSCARRWVWSMCCVLRCCRWPTTSRLRSFMARWRPARKQHAATSM